MTYPDETLKQCDCGCKIVWRHDGSYQSAFIKCQAHKLLDKYEIRCKPW